MVNVKSRKCKTESCGKQPFFGFASTKIAEYCAQHAPDGMVDVKSRKCRTEGCGKHPSFGVAGTKTGVFCAQHAFDGMVNVRSTKCRTAICGKIPSFGVAGTKTAEYCAYHAPEGMVNVCSEKYRTQSCGKKPSFRVANSSMAKYCAQHTRLKRNVERSRKREVGPQHYGKETSDKVIPRGAKHTTVHPPPAKTSQTSGVSRNSRKRVRHPDITSTTSKRAVALESVGGAGTMPDIDGQKSPVKRNSSVKTELQLSL